MCLGRWWKKLLSLAAHHHMLVGCCCLHSTISGITCASASDPVQCKTGWVSLAVLTRSQTRRSHKLRFAGRAALAEERRRKSLSHSRPYWSKQGLIWAWSIAVGWSTLSPLTYHQWPFSPSAFVPTCFGGPPVLALGL